MRSLEAQHIVSLSVGDPGTPTGKLGSAIGQENDRYINSEGDRQQLLLRCGDRFSQTQVDLAGRGRVLVLSVVPMIDWNWRVHQEVHWRVL